MMMEAKLIDLESQHRHAIAHFRRAMRRSRRLTPGELVHQHPYAAAGLATAAGLVLAFLPSRRKATHNVAAPKAAAEKAPKHSTAETVHEITALAKQLMAAFIPQRAAPHIDPDSDFAQPPSDTDLIPARLWEVDNYLLREPAW